MRLFIYFIFSRKNTRGSFRSVPGRSARRHRLSALLTGIKERQHRLSAPHTHAQTPPSSSTGNRSPAYLLKLWVSGSDEVRREENKPSLMSVRNALPVSASCSLATVALVAFTLRHLALLNWLKGRDTWRNATLLESERGRVLGLGAWE